ncbi:MAG TPA: hypothetical protein VNA68_01840 [Candidatus Dormibacteraeota bacterium]|nr:hypothetical protein [Candidatus Dormibacteraeota bacterium]
MKTVLLDYAKVKEFVSRASREVEFKDTFLLEKTVSEWTIAHRLAVYLEKYFPEYNIDCEYNRMQGSQSSVYAITDHVPKQLHGKKRRPDIIVHHRGHNSDNLLVIALKWRARGDDHSDLKAMRDELDYKYLCQVVIENDGLKLEWL